MKYISDKQVCVINDLCNRTLLISIVFREVSLTEITASCKLFSTLDGHNMSHESQNIYKMGVNM